VSVDRFLWRRLGFDRVNRGDVATDDTDDTTRDRPDDTIRDRSAR
jgi:hypothetical protein